MGENTQEANVQRSAHSGVLQPVYEAGLLPTFRDG